MRFILLVLTLIMMGCCGTKASSSGKPFTIVQYSAVDKMWYRGIAAPVSSNTVVTAWHVVNESKVAKITKKTWIKGDRDITITKIFHPNDGPEPWVILTMAGKSIFKQRDIFIVASKCFEPYKVITKRGTFYWRYYKVIGGDSGSPIINEHGELVGVVYGWRPTKNGNKPLYIPVKNIDRK